MSSVFHVAWSGLCMWYFHRWLEVLCLHIGSGPDRRWRILRALIGWRGGIGLSNPIYSKVIYSHIKAITDVRYSVGGRPEPRIRKCVLVEIYVNTTRIPTTIGGHLLGVILLLQAHDDERRYTPKPHPRWQKVKDHSGIYILSNYLMASTIDQVCVRCCFRPSSAPFAPSTTDTRPPTQLTSRDCT